MIEFLPTRSALAKSAAEVLGLVDLVSTKAGAHLKYQRGKLELAQKEVRF